MSEMWEGTGVTFDGGPEDRGRATRGFEEHVREVKERVPPERLLVYEVREGWGLLCASLGVEAPQVEPFPHLNEGEQFPRLMRRAVLSELAPRLGKAATASAAVVLGLWALGRGLRRP
jgi:Sulfotransferase domain